MYFESRVHELHEVQNATHAAQLIKSSAMQTNKVPWWISQDGLYKIYAVPDGHIDNQLLELAILRKPVADPDAPFEQIESITNGWIESAVVLGGYLQKAETSIFMMDDNVLLIVDKPKGDEKANFICGCCDEWFLGNVKEQLKFDQDAGYGICDSCRKRY